MSYNMIATSQTMIMSLEYTFSPVVAAADLVAVVTVLRCSMHLEEGTLSLAEIQLEAGTAGLLVVDTVVELP